jgi:HAD superfamily hydrolase (TIGR01549 family)
VTQIRGVLFDLGDTLVGRIGGHHSIVEEAAARGVSVAESDALRVWDDIQARARTPEEIAKGRDLSSEAHREAWTALYAAAEVFADGMGRALYEREIDPDRWVPFTDSEPTLHALHDAGVPVGVVSDTGWDYRPVFERLGWLHLFDAIVFSYEHGAAKPTPALFTTACAQLGVEPGQVLMVGDNALTDGGAIATGLSVLLLPPAWPGGERGLHLVVRMVDATR